METKGYNSFSIARAKELFLTDNIINIGDDFILAERTNEANYDLLRYPCRVDAYVAAFCKQGSFKCSINLKEYELRFLGCLFCHTTAPLSALKEVLETIGKSGHSDHHCRFDSVSRPIPFRHQQNVQRGHHHTR